MIEIPAEIIKDIQNYRHKVTAFIAGNIEPQRFKPYRVAMGVYEQREDGTYMVRTRIPSGIITIGQLKEISELAEKYGNRYIHFTTRQDIQFHRVTLENTANIMDALLEVGIITKGTGGNTARNIGCSPLAGTALDEVFDVTPYAVATTQYLLGDPTVFNLPRKFKISFSNTTQDTGNATIADLGFIAKISDGIKGFEVYGAGGLGNSSNIAVKLEDFIPANQTLYYVQAMKEIFDLEGDRTNKNRARIRFILYRLGKEAFINRYRQLVEKVKEEKNLELFTAGGSNQRHQGQEISPKHPLVYSQKEKGLYSVYIHPENGNLHTENLNRMIGFIEGLDYEISLRVSNTQGFFLRDVKGEDVQNLLDVISDFVSPFEIDNSIACAGAATCKLGLCLSQNLLSAVRKRFEHVDSAIKREMPPIYISGCPNSCGQHQKGLIGLSGKAKRVEDGLVPMYTLHFGGNLEAGKTVLGEAFGDLPAKKVPEFLYELALMKHQSENKDFQAFLKSKREAIKNLIKQFIQIESAGENPDLYYDFGSTDKFSLKGRGPGECSAGVLDVIRMDISNAQAYTKEYEGTKDSMKLYQASVAAARALLILKGIDTAKERVIFENFIQHFVETGYVAVETKGLIDTLLDYRLGDVKDLAQHLEKIEYLVSRVTLLYETLSPQLEITLAKEAPKESQEDEKHQETPDLEIVSLRGVKCPINFVKAKVALSKISSGNHMGFYLDDGEPIKNVPASLEAEGHEILTIDTNYDGFNLLVVKKK
ncbi:MAG: sulfurtransferase TusA family protein [Bacillota bacterium]